jgi:hypothetical protein
VRFRSPAASGRPTWSRWPQAVGLLVRGATVRVAGPVGLAVGTILTAVNQGSVLLAGAASWVTWLQVAVNYLTPFVVASIGYLGGCRADPGDRPMDREANDQAS